ncbi:MAG: hypothetical protein KY476_20035 [Planctomycetes bacterium]|nr:hypothetical protein [Planctomycetota bacterium]
MFRRILTSALIVAGFTLAAFGIQRWFDRHRAIESVEAFLDALVSGDRARLLAGLEPRFRRWCEAHLPAARPSPSEPSALLRARVRDLTVAGRTAEARVWISTGDFALRPTVNLVRDDTGRWLVTSLDGVLPDDLLRALSAHAGDPEALAAELSRDLADLPGVDVERVAGRGDGMVP